MRFSVWLYVNAQVDVALDFSPKFSVLKCFYPDSSIVFVLISPHLNYWHICVVRFLWHSFSIQSFRKTVGAFFLSCAPKMNFHLILWSILSVLRQGENAPWSRLGVAQPSDDHILFKSECSYVIHHILHWNLFMCCLGIRSSAFWTLFYTFLFQLVVFLPFRVRFLLANRHVERIKNTAATQFFVCL